MPELTFSPLEPGDLLAIERQASQRLVLGLPGAVSPEDAQVLAAAPVAWTVCDRNRIIACFGIAELFEGRQGLGWALLGERIDGAHPALTRFVRAQVAGCALARVECLARAHDLEGVLDLYPDLDTGQIVGLACQHPTPEIRWAMLVGFRPAHLLRCYGPLGESYMLLERLRPSGQRQAPMPLRQEAA